MQAKYNMTVEENIFVAKRNIIDYIWKSAKLEGLGVTYPDTEAIFNGMAAPNVKVTDIIAVNNLKHAWQFLIDNIDYPTDYLFICELNRLVGGDNLVINAGFIRNIPVSIGGTSWRPDMPIESVIKEKLSEIFKIESPTERAITLMLYCMRSQIYIDGNKRTAMLAANHIMIANGCGIISVPIEQQHEFTKLLIEYYETNDMSKIQPFIYNECIDGMDFRKQEQFIAEQSESDRFKQRPHFKRRTDNLEKLN